MTGPYDRMFANSPFDLNRDGKIDAAEAALIYEEFIEEKHGLVFGSGDYDEEEELLDELEIAGLDRDELDFMDPDERREALEDAGLDPDDYDDEF